MASSEAAERYKRRREKKREVKVVPHATRTPGEYPAHLKRAHDARREVPALMRPEQRELAVKFLDEYFSNGFNKSKAARAVGLTYRQVNSWLKRYEWFRLKFEELTEQMVDSAIAEMYRRGVDGWDEEVYGKDGFLGTVRKYDGRLLERFIAAHRPEYQPNFRPDGNNLDVNVGVIVVNDVVEDEEDFAELCKNAKQIQRDNRARVLNGRKADS